MTFSSVMQTLKRRVAVLLSLAAPLGLAAQQAPDLSRAPATIYLIRHAEKLTDGREDLSEKGFERAAALPQLFVRLPGGTRTAPLLPKPVAIFATAHSKRSNRPVETVTPLAAALSVPVSSKIDNEQYAVLAAELLGGKYQGKVVLVSWHHGTLPALATALGATPPYVWPEAQFDRVWRIDYAGGKATLTDLPQSLLPGDSK